jgi:hypothetical protein
VGATLLTLCRSFAVLARRRQSSRFSGGNPKSWLRAVAVFIVFAAIATSTGRKPLAAEPELPLLQNETARTAFISGVYKTCLERQRKLRENASLTVPELGQYCLCYGRAIADIVDATEFEAVTQGRAAPASFLPKTTSSAKLCRAKMRPEAQNTARERNMVTVTNECSRTYSPQETDFAASVVRNKYCACFASRLVDLAANDKLIANELNGGETPSPASSKAVKEIKDYCLQRL